MPAQEDGLGARLRALAEQRAARGAPLSEAELAEMREVAAHPLAGAAMAEVLQGEQRAPVVGDPAPDFQLPRLDGGAERVRLSDWRGRRPVALVFGSYT